MGRTPAGSTALTPTELIQLIQDELAAAHLRGREQSLAGAATAHQAAAERIAAAAVAVAQEGETQLLTALWIDIRRGDPGAARRLLNHLLGPRAGATWTGTETGAAYLERMHHDTIAGAHPRA
jgi:hypothetical protein